MPGRKDGHAGAPGPQVWLLGSEHPGADRSIPWDKSFGNLNDPDIIVVDLTTLTKQTLEKICNAEMAHARESIVDKMHRGGTIVVVTKRRFFVRRSNSKHYSNYFILPAFLTTAKTPEGHTIRVGADHDFKEYMKYVKNFTFKIDAYVTSAVPDAPTGFCNIGLAELPGQTITDNSGNRLGFTLQVVGNNDRGNKKQVPGTGRLVFLPPPPPESASEAIGKILSACGKDPPCGEAPPPWAEGLSFAQADCLQARIAELETDAIKIQDQIAKLDRQRDEILAHRRLLYAKGTDLESAVAIALKTVGFAEARQMGGSDQADCIIDINAGGYLHGLVEVKGADGRTGERHISQCVKWVDKAHEADGQPSKGIFVPNQHRSAEYPGSTKDRLWFEQKEIEYAKMRDVCIIPSCALFEAAKRALGGETPNREEIAARIAGAKGVLESVF